MRLDKFLSVTAVATRSEANKAVRQGRVLVNGETCTQRGKKLRDGDIATYAGKTVKVKSE